jgi:1,3-beta-glucanosyltransferase GAS1
VKGVYYTAPTSVADGVDRLDPLTYPEQCERDAVMLSKIGVNLIRVGDIDPALEHKECMNTFQGNGIYVWIDTTAYSYALEDSQEWDTTRYETWTNVIQTFAPYPNTFAYSIFRVEEDVGMGGSAPALLKGAIRDIKSYLQTKGFRAIPVGGGTWSKNPSAVTVERLSTSMSCGTSNASVHDFFTINDYTRCTDGKFLGSDVDLSNVTSLYKDYHIPVFIGSYGTRSGCARNKAREFLETEDFFGPEMSQVFSGAVLSRWRKINAADEMGRFSDVKTSAV